MKKPTMICGMLAAALLLTPVANAEGGRMAEYGNVQYTDLAEVIDVQPVVNTVRVATPRRECWDEEVRYRHGGYRRGDSYTPAIVGGIVGGIAGHQFGKGDGNTLMTIAGALLGGSVGRDHARYHYGPRYDGGYSTVIETRCSVHTEYHEEERVDGYLVTYRYDGRDYVTRMAYRPGDRIRVDIRVTPAE